VSKSWAAVLRGDGSSGLYMGRKPPAVLPARDSIARQSIGGKSVRRRAGAGARVSGTGIAHGDGLMKKGSIVAKASSDEARGLLLFDPTQPCPTG
jgi:hypothetical protein